MAMDDVLRELLDRLRDAQQDADAARQEAAHAREQTELVRNEANKRIEQVREVASRRLDEVRIQADRRLDEAHAETTVANRRLDAAHAETTAANRRIEALDARHEARHEELIAELQDVRRQIMNLRDEIVKVQDLLTWKSRTSTRNPRSRSLTHEFVIMAGRKKIVPESRKLVHVPKVNPVTGEVRENITTTAEPELRGGEFVRVSIMSRQKRTAQRAIKEHLKNGEYLLQRGYMANGIDLRQNIKTEGKRKYAEVVDLTGESVKRVKVLTT